MKSLITFSQLLLQDMEERCGVSAPRDHKTIASRVEHEGWSFLSITLPTFAKSLERALDTGKVTDDLFVGFSRSGRIPKFLGCFLQLVFDPCTGVLLDVPSIDAIYAIRQFCMAFAKIELPCSDERVARAFDAYIECEKDVRTADLDADLARLTRTSEALFGKLLEGLDELILSDGLIPKHGPGQTAEKRLGNEKFTHVEWTYRLERSFPALEHALPSHRYWQELDGITYLEPKDERPSRVVSVPKTLKTPRVIAIEPVCMQYAQQAVWEYLQEAIEGDDILSSFIGFSDQVPNQDMARIGSLDGSLATLDLSEASDRVSNQHVLALTAWHGPSRDAIQDCRSTKADVPGHGIIPLAKFASMGSALCFPLEAMVFTTIIISAIAQELNTSVTPKLLKELKGRVRVYGDDIIVPVEFAPMVARDLEAYGLKVNVHKSFWTGKFRESCGGDFYSGVRITPVRMREVFPVTIRHVDQIASTVSLRNQLFERGCEKTVAWLDKMLGDILPVYPVLPPETSGLGRLDWSPATAERHCDKLQRPLVRASVVKHKLPLSELEGPGGLMKYFLKRGRDPLSVDSFTRAGRARSARITTKYVAI